MKKIEIELTEEEVDVLEVMLFCRVTKEELRENFKIRCSLWEKIAYKFDEALVDETVKEAKKE